MLKMFQMSSGAIIFKLHFWEHAENLKHLHVQIAIKNERQGNEKARIYRKAVTSGDEGVLACGRASSDESVSFSEMAQCHLWGSIEVLWLQKPQ